jgi:hypothetical protein
MYVIITILIITIHAAPIQRICLPYLYGVPILLSSEAVRKFALNISKSSELAAQVRVLYLPDIGPFTSLCQFYVPLSHILCGSEGFRALPALADSLKVVPLHQLMALDIPRVPIKASTMTFERFASIRCLSLRGGVAAFDPVAVREDSLPCLEILDIHGPGAGLIDALARVK